MLALCIVFFGMDAGSTWDEPSRAEYGDLIIRWFATGFHDTRAISFENLYLEGGLFEVPAQLLAKISPVGVIETRHLLIALVGLGGIVATGLLAAEVADARAGFLAGAVLTLTPAWIGHAWFNQKDIPFATAATMLTWLATRIAIRSRPPRFTLALATGIVLGMALGIRPGGWFLVIYPACACLLCIAAGGSRPVAPSMLRRTWLTLWEFFIVAIPIAWLLMLVAWPWAWSSPVVGPVIAMKFASRVPFTADALFRGELLKPDAVPSSYLPTWFAITTPEFYFVAFAMGVVAILLRRRMNGTTQARGLAIVGLAIVFPIAAAMITRPAIYDGLRHFLFVFPPLAALAGIAVSAFITADQIPSVARAAGVGVLVVAGGMTMIDIVRLHPYEYAYFNRSFGGLPSAEGRFDTDYWGASYKEGFEWLLDESHTAKGPITVSSCNESSNRRLEYYRQKRLGASARISFVGPDARPDVFLESTRRYQCAHAEGPVIHTVSRLGVPLLYVRQTGRRF